MKLLRTYSIHKFVIVFYGFFLLGCKKEIPKRWYVDESVLSEVGSDYYLTSSSEESEGMIYSIVPGNNSVFGERHLYKSLSGNINRQMQFGFELPLGTYPNSFYFKDEQLYTEVKSQAYYSFKKKSNWYRIKKGWIKGEKIDGVWQIEYDIYFGDDYHMKSGAVY